MPRPALWLPAAALALAGALAVGLVTDTDSGYGLRQSDGESAVVLLDRIAEVAARTEVEPVRDDQLVYVKSLAAGAEAVEDGPFKPGGLTSGRCGCHRSPARWSKLALITRTATTSRSGNCCRRVRRRPAGIDRPTYKWLASLPTDPDELLEELYRLTMTWEGQEKAQAVFDKIGELLGRRSCPRRPPPRSTKPPRRSPG